MARFDFVTPTPVSPKVASGDASFSVVIAAYQAEATIVEAVESALMQTRAPADVVVCDDGSTDGTADVLAPYRSRITYLSKPNGGEASAKNAAARAATGEFVVILDADDVFLPERLEALGELAAARPDLDILTSDATLEVHGEVVRRCYTDSFRFEVDDQRRGILEQNFIFGHAAVRRERLFAVGGFDESIRWTADWDCWLRLILDGSRAGLVAEPLARYRLNAGSLSSQREAHIEGRLMTLAKAAARNDLSETERAIVRRSIAVNRRALTLASARAALRGRRDDARRRSLDVAFGHGFGMRTRVKAILAALVPGLAAHRLDAEPVETTGDIMLTPGDGLGLP